MFNQILRFIERHRLPIPDRYRLPAKYSPAIFLSTALITFGALMLLLAAGFGAHLFNQPPPAAHKAAQAGIDQEVFQLRAHAFAEVAAMETVALRQSLENIRLAVAQEQREASLRLAKTLRTQALQHLTEAEAITLPADKQPDIAGLRAEIDELDQQLASMPGTQGN